MKFATGRKTFCLQKNLLLVRCVYKVFSLLNRFLFLLVLGHNMSRMDKFSFEKKEEILCRD
jgi:hypothetical protein